MTGDPSTANDWCTWAAKERAAGRLAKAAEGFRRALTIDPRFAPAQVALASLLFDLGDLAGAEEVANQMATSATASPERCWVQARLAMAQGTWETARDRLRELLGVPSLNAVQSAEASLLLGLTLGELGDHDGAFAAAARGKALQRAIYAAQAGSREPEVGKLHRLTRWLEDERASFHSPPVRSAGDGPAAGHVFLLGFPRSGTTLLEQVLASHPDVRALEEDPLLAAGYDAFLSNEAACASLRALDAEEAAAWADHYWSAVQSRVPDVAGKLFIDKQPAGTLTLPLIARLFPQAKILFALRDPRDVVLSCFRQPFQMNAMTYAFTDLGEAAACYDACMTFAKLARSCLPLAWLNARHEALIEDFDGEIARILAFLELAPNGAMTDFATIANRRPIRTPSATQVRAGLNRRGLGRWRDFAEALGPALPTLEPWVERFGYVD